MLEITVSAMRKIPIWLSDPRKHPLYVFVGTRWRRKISAANVLVRSK
jgi:hypothetical protein